MNLIAALLIFMAPVTFQWSAPGAVEDNVSEFIIYLSAVKGNYSGATAVSAGKPTPNAQGVYTFTTDLDVNVKRYAIGRAKNSFGESANSNEIAVGKPSAPASLGASSN